MKKSDDFIPLTREEIDSLPADRAAELKEHFVRRDVRTMLDFAGSLDWQPERFALACLNTYMLIVTSPGTAVESGRALLSYGRSAVTKIEESLRKTGS